MESEDLATTTTTAARRIRAFARELSFDAVAIASAQAPLAEEFARYEAFLAAGYAGTMTWLEANRDVRRHVDGESMLPGAKSVVCLARSYDRDDEALGLTPHIARYARGRDYHNVVRKKLRQLAAFIRRLGGEARPITDDAPILERAWAARAGLGFVGKNGLLIVPGQGSFVLLGEVLTTLELAPDAAIPQRCGSCTRCLDACPTQAFPAPFVLDARRCISYATIEHRGVIDDDVASQSGDWVFGCDVCQDVCPFNAGKHEGRATTSFAPHERWQTGSLIDLLEGRLDVTTGTPLARAGAHGLARNAAIALGHRQVAPDSAEHAALVRATEHEDAAVREHAQRALSSMNRR